jgi:hypothetical protein
MPVPDTDTSTPGFRSSRASALASSRVGCRYVHQTERAQRHVEHSVDVEVLDVEVVDVEVLGVAAGNLDVGEPGGRRIPFEVGNHLRGEIGAEHSTAWRHAGSRRQRDETGPAGDVDDVLAWLEVSGGEDEVEGRLQLRLPVALVAARSAVPAPPLDPALQLRLHVNLRPIESTWCVASWWPERRRRASG